MNTNGNDTQLVLTADCEADQEMLAGIIDQQMNGGNLYIFTASTSLEISCGGGSFKRIKRPEPPPVVLQILAAILRAIADLLDGA